MSTQACLFTIFGILRRNVLLVGISHASPIQDMRRCLELPVIRKMETLQLDLVKIRKEHTTCCKNLRKPAWET